MYGEIVWVFVTCFAQAGGWWPLLNHFQEVVCGWAGYKNQKNKKTKKGVIHGSCVNDEWSRYRMHGKEERVFVEFIEEFFAKLV